MADVTVANTSPGIAGKTLACHDANGTTTGLWTMAAPLALLGPPPGNQTWRLSVAGSGNASLGVDGSGAGLTLDGAGSAYLSGNLSEKGRTTPLGHWVDVAADNSYFAVGGPSNGNWSAGAINTYAYALIGNLMLLTVNTNGGSWFTSGNQLNVTMGMTGALPSRFSHGTAVCVSDSMPYELCFVYAVPHQPWLVIQRNAQALFTNATGAGLILQIAIAI